MKLSWPPLISITTTKPDMAMVTDIPMGIRMATPTGTTTMVRPPRGTWARPSHLQ
ncbi:hypothetical protein NTCA1_29500 [Novosphingobium sp. TCA1]|nr:hypothetical protein NTCA1_29500 [Novosphingobium sp. TCA1]